MTAALHKHEISHMETVLLHKKTLGNTEGKITKMKKTLFRICLSTAAVSILLISAATPASAADENAARTLARQSNCFKCHAIDKKKEGPAWKDVAEKYRKAGDPAKAQARLLTHITTGEKAKFEDGHEEEHPIVKSKDQGEIKNLIDWILSLK